MRVPTLYRQFGKTTICIDRGNYWIGRGRWLVGLRDHGRIRPLFSERYEKNPNAHYRHIGRWCFNLDTDWMSRFRTMEGSK